MWMTAELPTTPEDLSIYKGDGTGLSLQGFALYDVEAEEYVEFGFPTINNDGKEKEGREVWETVEISEETLAPYANDGKDYRVDIFDSLSGGWGWIGFDTVRIPDADYEDPNAGNPADCDLSGALDIGDLSCVATIEHRDAVLGALGTIEGDLNGEDGVDFADFLILSGNFGNADASYAEGNIDLMNGVDFADFLALSSNFGQAGAGAAAVPEPGAGTLALLAAMTTLALARRSKRS